ncbi:polyketide synthase PksL [Serratia plymuthica 4Rx13]|uniref:Polyketide synthase n=2 Tax=Serratia plymuthica TaxID=82996 RepID=A0A318P207_SERPL|nr:polyketide synthase PksL [Serratia plymuthica 4Rx13]PYD40054.1 polyketide synthase [Serratia plymuthica]
MHIGEGVVMSAYTLSDSSLIVSGHMVLNEPILPAMGYVHFVASSLLNNNDANNADGIYPMQLKNAVWFSPMTLDKGPCEVNIVFSDEDDDKTYWVTSKVSGKATKRHATGVVSFDFNAAETNERPVGDQYARSVFPLPDITAQTFTHRLARDDIYRQFLSAGIDYRGNFQCLHALHCNRTLFWGQISADEGSLTGLPSPYILDAAIQTVLLGARKALWGDCPGQVYVPFSLDNILIHKPLTAKCDVFSAPRQVSSYSPDKGVFDVLIVSESGDVLVEMKGLHIRAYHKAGQGEQRALAAAPKDAGQTWAIAATFTAEPIVEPLQTWFSQLNWHDRIKFAPYNQVYQELLSPQSLLATNAAGVNAILCRLEDLIANDAAQAPTTGKNGVPQVSPEQINHHLTDCERFILPNGMEIAHLKPYETRYLYEEIFVEKTYVKHGISFAPGDVVVDIGGNIGMFSLFATTQCPDLRIFSCEPSPISHAILRNNLALYAPEAKALQVGIADKDGEAEFVFYPNSSVWSGFHTDDAEDGEALKKSMENEVAKHLGAVDGEVIREHLDAMIGERLQKQTYQVQMRSLASIMQEHHIKTIDLLKVDAEKCEWDILSSIADDVWPNIRQIVVEVHDKEGTTAEKIARLLRDKGYELAVVEEDMLKSSGLANFYARRPAVQADNAPRLSPFEQGVYDNFNDLLTLVGEQPHRRQGPTLFVLCPPSPAMRERFSAALLTQVAQMMHRIQGDKAEIRCIDLNNQLQAYGVTDYHDDVRDEMGHIPYTPAFFEVIASVLVRHTHASRRPPYKVIALDCDNTLWSGVVGEQGAAGVTIDANFRALQQFMLRQKERGMLLCLVSKNNQEDVKQVFDSRDDMVLQWDDFVDVQINWNAKSDNLQHLSKMLNLSLDSFVFLDDSPIECAEVSARCPQVLSLRLPENNDAIPRFLAHIWAFDHVRRTTDEDAKRTHLYQEQVRREAFRQSAFSMEAFIHGLGLDVTLQPATPDQAERLSQLTHRTNQFNLVKAPYSAGDILSRIQHPEQGCWSISVSDRFGDYGICGLCLFSEHEHALSVDGLLLSCRVLGRGVEYQVLNALGRTALERKKHTVAIHFAANDKNQPAENFLRGIPVMVQESSGIWAYAAPAVALAELAFTPSPQAIDSASDNAPSAQETASLPHGQSHDTWQMQQIAEQHGRLSLPQTERACPPITAHQPDDIDNDAVLHFIDAAIEQSLHECLKAKVDIDETKAFSEYGVDSFAAINLAVKLNAAFAIKLPSTVLFDYGCVSDLRRYLLANYRSAIVARMQPDAVPVDDAGRRARAPVNQNRKNANEADGQAQYGGDIAVIGMSARFPGIANVDEFWSMLLASGNCISDVPAERWDIAAYYDEDRSKPNKTYGRWGGFIEDIDKFDASFFGISGKEAKQMDPQQRLFLQESWHALEDAGYANRDIKNKKWGVYAGADAGDYQANLRRHGVPLDASSFMGNDSSILAARIAYFMDMKGPAMAIDTASSSSLAAVHLACESLRSGAVEMAIAGGVSIHTTVNFHILCAKAGMLSADGRCKPFDHRADGFVPGEAVGVVVLKRLQDAITDKDPIYSVIKGSAMNQDGKTNGITAPSSRSQTELICQVYDELNLSADELTYIEAHGTGTKLGDPIEITALTDAFRRQTQRVGFCAIGSVKSNIGHCVHASGVSALIKLLLSFKHRKLPPSANYEKPNPLIPFEETPFVVNTQVQDWQPNAQGKRIAAVSSFGFSGTNVHMVLEEFRPASGAGAPTKQLDALDPEPALLLLSARSEAQLHLLAQRLKAHLQQHSPLNLGELKDIAYTLQLGRESLGHRLAIAGKSEAEMLSGLEDYLSRHAFAQTYLTAAVAQGERNKGNSAGQQVEIDHAMQQRDLRGLAGQWLEGRQIDWSAWYPAVRQRVANLPRYPFEQERYWLPENQARAMLHAVSDAGAISVADVSPAVMAAPLAESAPRKRVLAALQTFQSADLQAEIASIPLTDEGQGIFSLRLHGAGGVSANHLSHLLTALKRRTDISVLLLCGDEQGFLADLEHDHELFLQQALYRTVLTMPFPVIAAVPGDCKGYAWLLACLCDFAVLSATARYHYASSDQRVSQPLYHLLSERFTPAAAQALLTDMRQREGRQLKTLGMLMPVFPSAEVAGEGLKLARELVKAPREALVELKQHLAATLVQRSAAPADSPIAFTPDAAVSGPLLPENGVQAFENGQLPAPYGQPRKVALSSAVIEAEAYDNGVLLVRLCERESRNKFSKAFVAGFEEIFAHIRQHHVYKVVVLTGYDHYFASGGTLETLQAIQKGEAKFTDEKIFALPLECEIPVIAAMQGHGIGPGWAVGMFCDEAIFSLESVYYSPYMRYGFTPGAGATLILPSRLGLDLAREVLFTAGEYKGYELLQRGLKNPVLERAQVLPFALAAASAVAQKSRAELVAWKTQRSQPLRDRVEANYAQELRMHERTFVGNPEVLSRIQQHFNLGAKQPESNAPQQSANALTVNTAHSVGAGQPAQDAPQALFDKVYVLLRRMLTEELQIKAEHVESEQPFVDLGLDSITGVTWVRKVNAEYGLTLNAADIYSYPNLKLFTALVIDKAGLSAAVADHHAVKANKSADVLPALSVDSLAADSAGHVETPSASVLAFLSQTLSQELQIKAQAIDPDIAFVDLGLDSITGVTWIRKINQHFGLALNAAEIYSYPTLQEFAALVQRYAVAPAAQWHEAPLPAARPEEHRRQRADSLAAPEPASAAGQAIAIVGMSGQFPKAKNLQQFWENLRAGADCISEVPAERWPVAEFFDSNPQAPGKTYSKWMGVLDDADKFDPLFFNISPREAELMDPQQRVFLEACWGCIEDSGYNPVDLSGSRCGVFVGCGEGDYEARFGMELNAQTFMGNAASILAARIAYHLNLQGPSLAIDTACSSSLVAMASACDSLVLGNCDLALAGGVSVLAGPSMHIMTSKAGMLSEEGRCFTFDQRANGFVPGEGVGVVLLKRLEEAIEDRDVIHGVIRGWGVNQDGKSNGITAPNGNAQSRLEQTVYTRFGIDPERIQYVEAHGTGTKLGDPVEVAGLKQSFAQFTRQANYCALGSVKSNIGHTLRAAGVASVLKVLLAMKNRQIPPMLQHQALNEHIALDSSPFYVNRELRDWSVAAGHRRQAAVSSFGFSGTNAHLVIEQFSSEEAPAIVTGQPSTREPALIVLSAKNDVQLRQSVVNLLAHVREQADRMRAQEGKAGGADAYLHSLAYTLQTGREAMSERLGFVAHTLDELQSQLAAALDGEQQTHDPIFRGKSKSQSDVLSLFNVDDDMHDLVQAWAAKGKLAKLLKIWVKGVNIDWDILYLKGTPALSPRKVSLPTYPFARERYWVDLPTAPAEGTRGAPADAAPVSGSLPQSLDAPMDFSTYENLLAASAMSAQDRLPGLWLLEHVLSACESSARGHVAELNYLLWGQPASVQDAVDGHIQTYFSHEDDGLYFQCVTEKAHQSVTHHFGQVTLNASAGVGSRVQELRVLEAQLEASHHQQAALQIKRTIDESGLHNHAVAEKMCFDGTQLLVRLSAFAQRPHQPQATQFRPALLTACWQLLSALNHYCHPQTPAHGQWYPFSLDSVMTYKPVPERATVCISPAPAEHASLVITGDLPGYDLSVYDESGALCMRLSNLKMVREEALLALESSEP